MSIKISFSQALDLAQMAVADKGEDYIYQRPYFISTPIHPSIREGGGTALCAYYDADGDPSCIVGHILHAMGVQLDPRHTANFSSVLELTMRRVISLDPKTKLFLTELQNHQDCGYSWGDALRFAQARAEQVHPVSPRLAHLHEMYNEEWKISTTAVTSAAS